MTPRRLSAVVLSFLWASSAAAQIRPVPAEAGRAPLAAGPAAAPGAIFGVVPGAPLAAIPLNAAPSASVSAAPSPALAAAPSAFGLPAAAPALTLTPRAAPSVLAPAAKPASAPFSAAPIKNSPVITAEAPALPPARAAALDTKGPSAALAGTEIGSDAPLDALFDGRAGRAELPAAEAGPERAAAENPGPALAPARSGRVRRAALLAVPAAVLAAGAAFAAPHAALAAVQMLGHSAYWLANPLAFLFTIPQIHRMLSRRSAEVSASMTVVGLVSALATTLCFAFDGKDLMMYRNLAQTLGFGAMLVLERHYARAPGKTRPSRRRALVETVGLVLGFGALTLLAGPAMLAAVPAVALMSSLLAPFQMLAGFGFTYMMYAQLKKMSLERSIGDSSAGMTWAFLGTKVIWVWSFATMLSLSTAPAWLTLAAGTAFAVVCWLAARAALSRLLRAPWAFLPEKLTLRGRTLTRNALGDAAAFAVLSSLILALSAGGHFAFMALLGIPTASASLFAMYLIYTVQNLVACEATWKTLRLQSRFGRGRPGPLPESTRP